MTPVGSADRQWRKLPFTGCQGRPLRKSTSSKIFGVHALFLTFHDLSLHWRSAHIHAQFLGALLRRSSQIFAKNVLYKKPQGNRKMQFSGIIFNSCVEGPSTKGASLRRSWHLLYRGFQRSTRNDRPLGIASEILVSVFWGNHPMNGRPLAILSKWFMSVCWQSHPFGTAIHSE